MQTNSPCIVRPWPFRTTFYYETKGHVLVISVFYEYYTNMGWQKVQYRVILDEGLLNFMKKSILDEAVGRVRYISFQYIFSIYHQI